MTLTVSCTLSRDVTNLLTTQDKGIKNEGPPSYDTVVIGTTYGITGFVTHMTLMLKFFVCKRGRDP